MAYATSLDIPYEARHRLPHKNEKKSIIFIFIARYARAYLAMIISFWRSYLSI